MAGWTLEPDYRHLAADFGSLDSVFALEGERLTRDPLSEVIRIERDGVRYYVKRYRSAGKGLRRYLARPRIKAEWQNLKRFEKWGIPTAEVVAWGLERKAGAFQRGAMITRELPGTEDLSVLACNRDPRLKDPRWVDGVSRQIAKATRLMHDQHFTHNDLKWRNLLVDDQPLVYFIDCPNGAFWWSFMLRYRITKDLACLDKVAKYHLSRTQRLRFYLQYRRRRHLNESDKKRIRQVVAFFEGARMSVFIAAQDHDLLQRNRLDSFDALWALQLDAVDEPNTERGGWSSVYRLDLGDSAYYLKRQSNHLTRSLRHPLGEPTFAREFRNIERYRALGIPALQAAFFAQQAVGGERQAILLTRALDGWQDLDTWLASWHDLAEERRRAILRAVGRLARQLHAAGQMHGCFYPKHVFLREGADGVFEACLIDLEKTRPIWFGRRDQVKDLEPMLRRAPDWSEADVHEFISAYVDEPLDSAEVEQWYRLLDQRRRRKESRR